MAQSLVVCCHRPHFSSTKTMQLLCALEPLEQTADPLLLPSPTQIHQNCQNTWSVLVRWWFVEIVWNKVKLSQDCVEDGPGQISATMMLISHVHSPTHSFEPTQIYTQIYSKELAWIQIWPLWPKSGRIGRYKVLHYLSRVVWFLG